MSRGLQGGRRMRREGQMVESTQGRTPVWGGRRKQELDLRGSHGGCSLGCSSLMDWASLKTGFQENASPGNRCVQACGSGSLQGCGA